MASNYVDYAGYNDYNISLSATAALCYIITSKYSNDPAKKQKATEELNDNALEALNRTIWDSSESGTETNHTVGSIDIATLDGNDYITIQNSDITGADDYDGYYLTDIITSLKGAGYTNKQIADAINTFNTRSKQEGMLGGEQIKINGKTTVANTDVKDYNINFNDSTKKIQKYLDENYADLDAYVSVVSKDDSDYYSVRVSYISPSTGERVYYDVTDTSGMLEGTLGGKSFDNLFNNNTELGIAINAAKGTKTAEGTQQNAGELADEYENFIRDLNTKAPEVAGAKTNLNLSQAQQDSLKVKNPSYNNQTVLQAIANSDNPLAKNLLNDLTNLQENRYNLATLDELRKNSQAIDDIEQQLNDINISSAEQAALSNIIRDPSLAKSLTELINKDAAAGTIAGARAANTQALADEAKNAYAEQAAEVLKNTSELAATERNSILSRAKEDLNTDVLGTLKRAQQVADERSVNVDQLVTALEALRIAANTQIDAAERESENSKSVVKTNAANIETDADRDSRLSSAASDAVLNGLLNRYGDLQKLEGYADVANSLKQIIDSSKIDSRYTKPDADGGGVTTVRPDLVDLNEGTIDETLLQRLLDSGLIDTVLSQQLYDYATKGSYTDANGNVINASDKDALARVYGLDTYLDAEKTADKFRTYAEEANRASDRTFNQAQRAYLAAVTAGDIKTAETLTNLARTAGAGKQNIYKTSALTGSLNRQLQNANVGNTMQTDYLNQIKNNQLNIDNAVRDAETWRQNILLGDSANPNAPSLHNVALTEKATNQKGAAGYTGVYGEGMSGQSSFNDIVASGNRFSNETLTNTANTLTGYNTNNAVNNITNKATLDATVNSSILNKNILDDIAKGKVKVEDEKKKN